MTIFGGKRIAELEQELASVRAQLEQVTRERNQAEHDKRELEGELRHAKERMETFVARLDQLATVRTRKSRSVSPVLPEWELVEPDEEPEDQIVRARYTVEGRPRHLQAIELMFEIIVTAGEVGATVWFDVMVDGDGGGRVQIRRGNQLLELTEDEQTAWFRTLGELPEHNRLRDVIRRDGVVCVELT